MWCQSLPVKVEFTVQWQPFRVTMRLCCHQLNTVFHLWIYTGVLAVLLFEQEYQTDANSILWYDTQTAASASFEDVLISWRLYHILVVFVSVSSCLPVVLKEKTILWDTKHSVSVLMKFCQESCFWGQWIYKEWICPAVLIPLILIQMRFVIEFLNYTVDLVILPSSSTSCISL